MKTYKIPKNKTGIDNLLVVLCATKNFLTHIRFGNSFYEYATRQDPNRNRFPGIYIDRSGIGVSTATEGVAINFTTLK
jgi:hypothetical protein